MYPSWGTCGKQHFRALEYFVYTTQDKREEESPYSLPKMLSFPQRILSGASSRKAGETKSNSSRMGQTCVHKKPRTQKLHLRWLKKDKSWRKKNKGDRSGNGYLEKREKKWTTQNLAKMRLPAKRRPRCWDLRQTRHNSHINRRALLLLNIVRLGKIIALKILEIQVQVSHYSVSQSWVRGKSQCTIYPQITKLGQLLKIWPFLCDFCGSYSVLGFWFGWQSSI